VSAAKRFSSLIDTLRYEVHGEAAPHIGDGRSDATDLAWFTSAFGTREDCQTTLEARGIARPLCLPAKRTGRTAINDGTLALKPIRPRPSVRWRRRYEVQSRWHPHNDSL
jgi:hypothetical protein